MRGISSLGLIAILLILIGSLIAIYILLQSQPGGENPSRIPNGIYIYKNNSFVPLDIQGPFIPREPGYYFLYFHNNLCPHCQVFYPKWINYLKNEGGVFRNIAVVEVVCDWFTQQCNNDAARVTFELYGVSSSPSFLLIKINASGRIENIWNIGEEYLQLQQAGKIPGGEFLPQYLEVIVRSKITS
ncbi:MAG TPA: hypothetical protein VNL13_02635 [Sulfolobales archaeon]|nr:hypothetical protein [Sulfolobales archaeon]